MPTYKKYLASNGLLGAGDPVSTDDVRAVVGGDFGRFWKIVFPLGNNDCDLDAAITNITDKINQLVGVGDIKKYVQSNIEGKKQGDAYAYISNSIGALRTILSQYQAEYKNRISKGGGCSHGTSRSNYETIQQQKREAELQIQQDLAAAQAALALKNQQSATVGATGSKTMTIALIGGGVLLAAIIGFAVLKK